MLTVHKKLLLLLIQSKEVSLPLHEHLLAKARGYGRQSAFNLLKLDDAAPALRMVLMFEELKH